MKIIGPWTSPTIYSENPGTVEFTSSDPSVATVDASVVIPGTRFYHIDGQNGDYLLCPNVGQTRVDVTWFFEVDWSRVINTESSVGAYDSIPLFGSIKSSWVGNRWNWYFQAIRQLNSTTAYYYDSLTSANQPAGACVSPSGPRYELGIIKYVMTKDVAGNISFYRASSASVNTAIRASTGTMGVDEVLVIWASGLRSASKILRVANLAEIDDYFNNSIVPAANQEFSFLGNHEINPDNPKIFDSSVNKSDLYNFTAASIDGWRAPGIMQRTADSVTVVPFQPFIITPISAGTFTITARRRRQGVPDRTPPLPDAELYETTSETFTITEMPVEVTQYVRLMITTNREGTVVITSSDPAVVTFPASVVVGPSLQYEVLGTVVGAGTSTITTTMDGTLLDTTTVTIEAEPTVISCGPSQNIRSRI